MKMTKNLFLKIFAALAVVTTAASCSDDIAMDSVAGSTPEGENIVSFSLQPQLQNMNTRSATLSTETSISQGGFIDVLLFAVYEKEADGSYTLATQFQKESEPIGNVEAATGQNLLKVNGNSWPLQIQLVVDQSKTYKVAFWAQSSECDAYDTSDLTNVVVSYSDGSKGLLNNEETRDAFCASSLDFAGSTTVTQEVLLKRPFAQINVGTAGWDYEGAAALKPSAVSYLESSFEIDGVATDYNVLTGKVTTDKSKLQKISFSFNRIPAFLHIPDDELNSITYDDTSKDEFLKVRRYKEDEVDKTTGESRGEELFHYRGWNYYYNFKNGSGIFEEYHYTETDENGNIVEKTAVTLFDEGVRPLTEIYKYMSMCYVLVPESDETKGCVLNSVSFQARGYELEGDFVETPKELTSQKFTITNVPVQKNWRTNIIGESFFTFNKGFKLYIIPDYCGEYNYLYDKDKNDDDSWNVGLKPDTDGNNEMMVNGNTGAIYEDFNTNYDDYYGDGSLPGPPVEE